MSLIERLNNLDARIGVLGLGHAGLPTALQIADAGFSVVGFDVNPGKIAEVNALYGESGNGNGTRQHGRAGHLQATGDFTRLRQIDVALICVPTPLTEDRQADLFFIEAAAESIRQHLHRDMLVVLQSTCPPGTTRQTLLGRLETAGLEVGSDFHLAFAPERIDPGNSRFNIRNTPKIVGGVTEACTEVACAFFRHFVDRVIPVSSPDIAEMAKLVENAFRFVNISFVNEMALLCDRLGLNVWEVIDAASSKPFAFMPHFPSPGVGGHCIPVVPWFLNAAAQEHAVPSHLIPAAGAINEQMPRMIVGKIEEALADIGRMTRGARVLLLGLAYKRDIADIRESPALRILEDLAMAGASICYHDPLIDTVSVGGRAYSSQPLTPDLIEAQDCVVILTAHSTIDFAAVRAHARLVVDTRRETDGGDSPTVLNVWKPRPARALSTV